MPLASGQVLQNRYRIVSLLGRGGMGAVYRAWDTRLDVAVALKEMTSQPGLDPHTLNQLRRQFQKEANVLARLNHPHLVRVTDFFEERSSAYLAMDFVEGESLADRIARQGSLPEASVHAWADQLLDALGYCHSQSVIHRDVKPQNIIVRSDGRATLVDFGLVKLWDPRDPRTQTAMRGAGTPEYAPPEQYDLAAGHTDARSDLYGLGATLYHALSGQAPPTATMRVVDPAAMKPLWTLVPGVSTGMEAAIARALELQPAARFQSAQEMQTALRGVAPAPPQGKRAKTRVMPGAQPIAPPRRLPRWAWILGGLVLLAVLVVSAGGIGFFAGWMGSPSTVTRATPDHPATVTAQMATLTALDAAPMSPAASEPTTPRPSFTRAGTPIPWPLAAISPENADRVRQVARWGQGDLGEIAFSPDGRLLAEASSLGIFFYDTETWEEVQFIETDRAAISLAFSPGGEILASGSEDRKVHLWRVSDGMGLQTLEGHDGEVNDVAFSRDGATLASGSRDGSVRLWQVSDGTLLYTLTGGSPHVLSMAFSPDGTTLASASYGGPVQLWRATDGTPLRTLEGHADDIEAVAFSPDGAALATGSRDRTVRLWRVSDGTLLQTLEDTGYVNSVAFSPDGTLVASGSMDAVVRLWGVAEE